MVFGVRVLLVLLDDATEFGAAATHSCSDPGLHSLVSEETPNMKKTVRGMASVLRQHDELQLRNWRRPRYYQPH